MKSPYSYVEFNCEMCVACDACVLACPCDVIIYDWDYLCLVVDKRSCMGCYCDIQCVEICPAGALTLKYESQATK